MKFYLYRKLILGILIIVSSSLLLVACGDSTATSSSTQSLNTATTIVSPTTLAASTTVLATTAAQTTAANTTVLATTAAQTTAASTTVLATTAAQTTAASTTTAPSTTVSTTVAQTAPPTTLSSATTAANATTVATASTASATVEPKPTQANDAQANQLIKVMNDLDKLKEYVDAVIEGSPKLSDLQKHAGELVAVGPRVKASLANALTGFSNDPVATVRLKNIESNLNNTLAIAQKLGSISDLKAGIDAAIPMAIEIKDRAYPNSLALLVDTGVTGTISVSVSDSKGQPLPNSYVSIYAGPVFQMGKTDATGKASFNQAPAFDFVQVKSYQEGYIYHEEKVPLPRKGQASVTIRMPKMPDPAKAPTGSKPVIKADPANPRLLAFNLTATDPQNDVSEQVYAVNVSLGIGVVLIPKGENVWAGTYTLPTEAAKTTDWVFFAVDRVCNQGNFLTASYALP